MELSDLHVTHSIDPAMVCLLELSQQVMELYCVRMIFQRRTKKNLNAFQNALIKTQAILSHV